MESTYCMSGKVTGRVNVGRFLDGPDNVITWSMPSGGFLYEIVCGRMLPRCLLLDGSDSYPTF